MVNIYNKLKIKSG